jgi:hypothetical protein
LHDGARDMKMKPPFWSDPDLIKLGAGLEMMRRLSHIVHDDPTANAVFRLMRSGNYMRWTEHSWGRRNRLGSRTYKL